MRPKQTGTRDQVISVKKKGTSGKAAWAVGEACAQASLNTTTRNRKAKRSEGKQRETVRRERWANVRHRNSTATEHLRLSARSRVSARGV